MQCCPSLIDTTLYRLFYSEKLSVKHGPTFHQVKILCNVAQEVPDNIAHGKILFNIVVILLGQHCTGKNPVQCCPRDSRQHCIGKNPVQCLNTITFRRFFLLKPVKVLTITGCYKCLANIAQVFPHEKNPGPTLNKRTRLYGTDRIESRLN